MRTLTLASFLVLALPGCSDKGSDSGGADSDATSGTTDGGTTDGGTTDGGTDGGGTDGGTTDGGTTDGGTTDGGTTDGGTTDGGTTDGGTTDGGTTDGGTSRYHPVDYLDPAVHGIDAKFQADACLSCHGEDLAGTAASADVGCDDCHHAEWRTDCTFCHGGVDNETGAPPEDIDDSAKGISFSAHTAHVTESSSHLAFDCVQCHTVPADVLSAGHFLVDDASAGLAEVVFGGGLSAAGSFDGAGTASCSNLYCHGNGQGDNGSWSVADGAPDCGSCHPSMDDSREIWATMSGDHAHHIGHNLGCHECHGATVERSDDAIKDNTLHVNGAVDHQFDGTIVWDPKTRTCTGSCHSENHLNRPWE